MTVARSFLFDVENSTGIDCGYTNQGQVSPSAALHDHLSYFGLTGAHEEIDYSAKLKFSDDEGDDEGEEGATESKNDSKSVCDQITANFVVV